MDADGLRGRMPVTASIARNVKRVSLPNRAMQIMPAANQREWNEIGIWYLVFGMCDGAFGQLPNTNYQVPANQREGNERTFQYSRLSR
jgi:hypothetical protein